MPKVGLEPTRPCGHWILSPARLPIPPLRLVGGIIPQTEVASHIDLAAAGAEPSRSHG